MPGEQRPADNERIDIEANAQDWEKTDKAVAKMLAAVLAAQSAKTTREFAHARVRIHEPAISKMLKSGVSQVTILECLVSAMPTIPKEDLRAALEAIRKRALRENKESHKEPLPIPGSSTIPRATDRSDLGQSKRLENRNASEAVASTAPVPSADGSDRMPGESEEDYLLRKSLEPKPNRRKFIGEGE